MTEKELTDLTDKKLLQEAKKMKSSAIKNAALIGFLVGVIICSVAKNSLGFFTLIPLFFVYNLINKSSNDKALKKILKERNLK